MAGHDKQSFFTPAPFLCLKSRLIYKTYNLAHTLLNRSQSSHLFIPIRSLQYIAIIEKEAFWFVDSLAYAVSRDEGGRLIKISWHPLQHDSQRDGLTQHMDCSVIFYGEDMLEVQNRLKCEFHQAMVEIDQRHRNSLTTDGPVNILPLRPRN